MEQWAEIRRLHRSEHVPIKEIARRLGIARNTVRSALKQQTEPRYQHRAAGSIVDTVEPEIRKLLAATPRMPATVIAERIGWEHSITILRDRVRELRPEYAAKDPADRLVHEPGGAAQMDLWFPEPRIPVGYGQALMLPVLVMTLTYSRFLSAVMLPSRQGGDLLAGMWQLISGVGRVSKSLVWDRESAIAGKGKPTHLAAAFAGTLGTRYDIAPPRDPGYKGMTERNNQYLESSFLPGRTFNSPTDFNVQLAEWLPAANARRVRSLGGRPVDYLDRDLGAMTVLPPYPPVTGFQNRVRLARNYYVRVEGNDYSVGPRMIGRLVDVTARLTRVIVVCDGATVANHARCWVKQQSITDPQHVAVAKSMRTEFTGEKRAREQQRRAKRDSQVRFLTLDEYDALYGSNHLGEVPGDYRYGFTSGLSGPSIEDADDRSHLGLSRGDRA